MGILGIKTWDIGLKNVGMRDGVGELLNTVLEISGRISFAFVFRKPLPN